MVGCTSDGFQYEVRSYVTEAGCGDLLNELYAVCEDPAALDWERLPGRFVLKATNACGRILVCAESQC